MEQNVHIGIIGTGRMGTAFSKRLLEKSFRVTVWNRSSERAEQLAQIGAEIVTDINHLFENADILISSLTDFNALKETFSGKQIPDLSGKLVIEMSTILPDEQLQLAKLIRDLGGTYLECPVSGTVGPALKGQLLGFAGGDKEVYERALPVLNTLCKRVELIGPISSGSAMKLAVNLPLAMYWNTLGEAVQLLDSFNLPAELVISLLADSSGGPNVLKNRHQVIVDSMEGTDQIGTFDINGLRKDLTLAIAWASQAGRELPLALQALKVYDAAQESGLGKFDGASLSRFVSDHSENQS